MLGGPFNAYGSIMSGQMTADTLNAQAGQQDAMAREAEAAGKYNASRQMMAANQKIGQSVAAYGAAGVTSNSGSVGAVLASSAANAEADRLNILHGADIKAINYNNQASMDRYGAQSAIAGSHWQAFGAITGGAINGLSNNTAADPTKTDGGDATAGTTNQAYEGSMEGAGEADSGYMAAGAGEGASAGDFAAMA